MAKYPKLAAVDRAVGREGAKIVLLTRLSPIFPFTILNYFYGVTAVPLGKYMLASWIGMFPGTVLYVYLGSAAGEVAMAVGGKGGRTPFEWALFLVGLLATLAVTIVITRVAKRAIAHEV